MASILGMAAQAVVTAAAIGAGFWAYQENYKTRHALSEVSSLHSQIGAQRARMGMLEAEWAYLNRPDRLRQLTDMNFRKLELIPMMPSHFGHVAQAPMPPDILPPIMGATEIVSYQPESGEPL
jgi:hypothetical protein